MHSTALQVILQGKESYTVTIYFPEYILKNKKNLVAHSKCFLIFLMFPD